MNELMNNIIFKLMNKWQNHSYGVKTLLLFSTKLNQKKSIFKM
jgi:hypothetical protein